MSTSTEAAASSLPPAPAEQVESETNLEIAPVVAVLTEDQKDLLLLRALQKDPSMGQHLLAMAAEPITAEAAASRVESLDAAAIVGAVRSYMQIAGCATNALVLLVALTEALTEAMQELVQLGKEWPDSEELETVEAMPPAGTVAALWKEVIAASPVEAEEADELRQLLEEVQAAASGVRSLLPALLVGPEGGTDGFAQALKLLPQEKPHGKAAKKARTK